ncbi:hypothetical protein ACH4Y0_31770 [Streptomyces sp. NPDC020707]|uniref:hypothetical protein n=1 Tax=Streptomyces sp. NPDC020707 TaxID=3365084 RepID=UPI0037BC294B
MHIGAVAAGTTTGYRRTPGPLTRQQLISNVARDIIDTGDMLHRPSGLPRAKATDAELPPRCGRLREKRGTPACAAPRPRRRAL